MQEGWSEKLHEQAHEGCNIAGIVRVNKVVGNIHFSPGRSFRTAAQNIYELVPYLKEDGNRHDFSHSIQTFAFQGDDEFDFEKANKGLKLKEQLGVINPLDGTSLKVSNTIEFGEVNRGLTFYAARYRRPRRSTCSNTSSKSSPLNSGPSTAKLCVHNHLSPYDFLVSHTFPRSIPTNTALPISSVT